MIDVTEELLEPFMALIGHSIRSELSVLEEVSIQGQVFSDLLYLLLSTEDQVFMEVSGGVLVIGVMEPIAPYFISNAGLDCYLY